MAPAITCATCRWFDPWPQNPTAAMGRCMHDARHGYFFANERHRCVDHSSEPQAKAEAANAAENA